MEQKINETTSGAEIDLAHARIESNSDIIYSRLEALIHSGNLDKLTERAARKIKDRLPLPDSSLDKTILYLRASDFCCFSAIQKEHRIEVHFLVPGGFSPAEIISWVRLLNGQTSNDKAEQWNKDSGMNHIDKRDRFVTFYVYPQSNNLDRDTQTKFLRGEKLRWADRWMLSLGAALYSDRYGFPEKLDEMGEVNNHSDLFGGKRARCEEGDISVLRRTSANDQVSTESIAVGKPAAEGQYGYESKSTVIRSYLRITGYAVATAFAMNISTRFSRVISGSMEPNVREGDVLLLNKLAYGAHTDFFTESLATWSIPERGDVIIFRPLDEPNTTTDESSRHFVKRVIAIPGDTVQVKDTNVFINGKKLAIDTAFAWWQKHGSGRDFGPAVVPPGRVFVMGDNRDDSRDSRYFYDPYVPIERVEGRVEMICFNLHTTRRNFCIL